MIKEPKDVDFIVNSEPWTEEELRDFRKLMVRLKSKNISRKKANLKSDKRREKISE